MDGEEALLTPLGCSKCFSQKCIVRPILPNYTETHEVGLFICCAECGEEIANLALNEECGKMMLDVEMSIIKDELQLTEL